MDIIAEDQGVSVRTMIIENELEIAVPVERAWLLLLDIPFVAPCLPGTSLTTVVDERTYEGQVALKLGPVSLAFSGQAVIEEIDPVSRTVRVAAKGREERGRGSAHATVSFTLAQAGEGTRVAVATDLMLAGSIIQYARGAGVITRTAQQLVDQFAERLHQRIESGEVPAGADIKVGSLLWQGIMAGLPNKGPGGTGPT